MAGGGGGGWACRHGVLFSSAAGGADWPVAIRSPSLGPFPSIGGGAHQPLTTLCPSSSSLPNLSLYTSLSFPLVSCANGAPGLSLFHLLCSRSAQRRATALAVGQVRPRGHPKPTVRDPSPTAAFGHGGGGGCPLLF